MALGRSWGHQAQGILGSGEVWVLLCPSWSWVFTELLSVNPLALPWWYLGGAGTRATLPALPCAAHYAHSTAGSLLLPAIFISELAKYPAKIAKPLSAPGKFV